MINKLYYKNVWCGEVTCGGMTQLVKYNKIHKEMNIYYNN